MLQSRRVSRRCFSLTTTDPSSARLLHAQRRKHHASSTICASSLRVFTKRISPSLLMSFICRRRESEQPQGVEGLLAGFDGDDDAAVGDSPSEAKRRRSGSGDDSKQRHRDKDNDKDKKRSSKHKSKEREKDKERDRDRKHRHKDKEGSRRSHSRQDDGDRCACSGGVCTLWYSGLVNAVLLS